MRAGAQPACWECERAVISSDGQDAIELWTLLDLGMPWDLALETMEWAGTRADLYRLAQLINVIKREQGPQRASHRCPFLGT